MPNFGYRPNRGGRSSCETTSCIKLFAQPKPNPKQTKAKDLVNLIKPRITNGSERMIGKSLIQVL